VLPSSKENNPASSLTPLARLREDMDQTVSCDGFVSGGIMWAKCGANLQGVLQVLINFHDRSLITTAVTIIWSFDMSAM
jgi:hypothetical protein